MDFFWDNCKVNAGYYDNPDEMDVYATVTRTFITKDNAAPININPVPLEQHSVFWQFIALLLAAFIFASIKIVRKNFFRNLSAAYRSRPIFKQLLRDGMLFPSGLYIPLFIAIVLSWSVFLLQLDEELISFQYFSKDEELRVLLKYLAGVTAFLSGKYLLHYLSGLLFKTVAFTKEYLNNSFLFSTVSSLVFIPLLFVSAFSKSSIVFFTLLIIALVIILFKFIRGFIISLEIEKYSHYQNLIYLCTLEILPVLIIYRMVMNGGY